MLNDIGLWLVSMCIGGGLGGVFTRTLPLNVAGISPSVANGRLGEGNSWLDELDSDLNTLGRFPSERRAAPSAGPSLSERR